MTFNQKYGFEIFPGAYLKAMPELVSKGLAPISVARTALIRQLSEGRELDFLVRTGDGSAAGKDGDVLISLDDPYLLGIDEKKELYDGALVLTDGQWDYLKSREDKVLHLTPEEVDEAKKGYIKKNGLWIPANKTVGRIYEGHGRFPGLFRGEVDIRKYLGLVAERSGRNSSLMNFYSNTTITKDSKPTMRSLAVYSFGDYSDVYGPSYLDHNYGRLAGVAPEAPEEKELANEGVSRSTYRGYVPLEKRVAEGSMKEKDAEGLVTEEEMGNFQPWYARMINKMRGIFER